MLPRLNFSRFICVGGTAFHLMTARECAPPTSSSPFPHHCSPSESRGLPSTSWLRVCLPSRFTSRQRVCLPRTPPLPSLSLQSVSVKGAAFHLMAARVEGYDPDQTLSHKDAKGEHFEDKGLAGKVGGGRQGGWGPAGIHQGRGKAPLTHSYHTYKLPLSR